METKQTGLRKLAEQYGAMALRGDLAPNGDEGLAITSSHIVQARIHRAGIGNATRCILSVGLEGDFSQLDIHQARALTEVLLGFSDAQDGYDVARAA